VIRGYAEQPSPRPGERWTLRVSTDAPVWRVEFYRCGAELAACGGGGWFPSVDAPPHLPGQDWGQPGTGLAGEHLEAWPAYRFSVPERWTSGVYLAVLVEGDGHGGDAEPRVVTTADARSGTALLVVRAPVGRPAALLYKLPLLTYQAYNLAGADGPATWCLYDLPERLPLGVRPAVSLHRPGGGTGGMPWDIGNHDPYDPTPRQTFVHWDGRFIGWLERAGYEVDYCTDVDLHREGEALLSPYRLLVSAGHDEYWSDAMRAAVERHVTGGGNVAFFGGNTCWWRVEVDEHVVYRRTRPWWEEGRPENSLTGVSFRNGGERDRDDHPTPLGYRIQHAAHWVYEGTGLRDGDLLGAAEHLVGYECDGALFDRSGPETTRTATGTDGTPEEFVILGVGDCRSGGWGLGNAAATMGVYTRGGTVFNAATTDWPRVLTGGTAAAVERVTRNVLDRLGRC
jgi:hypothetical protein